MTSLTFGDVFEYNEKEWIYLAETEDILYAARILNVEKSRALNNAFNNALRKNSPAIEGPIYSFVILQTKELRERAAHFANTGNDRFDNLIFTPLNIKLAKEDLREIKNEITRKRCVSLRLKELVRDIQI